MGAKSRQRREYRKRVNQMQGVEPLRLIRSGAHIDMGEVGGAARDPVDATFTYFGDRFRVNPDLTEVTVVDLMDRASAVEELSEEGMRMAKDWLREHVHPEDFNAFWKLARNHRQTVTDLLTTAWQILGGITQRPTSPPSDSSGGRSNTTPNSVATSSGPVGVASDDLRSRYLQQIERHEALGTENGVAIAEQIALAAEARGIDVTRDSQPA